MKRFFTIALAMFTLVSYGQQRESVKDQAPLKEGKLIYEVFGDISGWGWKFSFSFDSTNVRVDEKFALTAGRIKIIDKNTKEVLNLDEEFRLNWKFKESFAYYHTIEGMVKEAQSSTFGDTLKTTTQDFKNILGFECQKTVLKLGRQVTMTFWTTDRIKTGIILPGTPLALEHAALEMEINTLGETRTYKAVSVEGLEKSDKGFEHILPDKYKLLVPESVYSINNSFTERGTSETHKSVEYPYYGGNAQVLKEYVLHELAKIVGDSDFNRLTYHIWFKVDKNGKISNVHLFDFVYKNEYNRQIKKMLLKMPKWTPGRVRGKPVNSEVSMDI